jgi:hypothetical protein
MIRVLPLVLVGCTAVLSPASASPAPKLPSAEQSLVRGLALWMRSSAGKGAVGFQLDHADVFLDRQGRVLRTKPRQGHASWSIFFSRGWAWLNVCEAYHPRPGKPIEYLETEPLDQFYKLSDGNWRYVGTVNLVGITKDMVNEFCIQHRIPHTAWVSMMRFVATPEDVERSQASMSPSQRQFQLEASAIANNPQLTLNQRQVQMQSLVERFGRATVYAAVKYLPAWNEHQQRYTTVSTYLRDTALSQGVPRDSALVRSPAQFAVRVYFQPDIGEIGRAFGVSIPK